MLPFSCPFDYVKIYDGFTNEAEEIGVYCGTHKNIELFSTREALTIDFVTKSGRVEPTKKTYLTYQDVEEDKQLEQRGFKASFEVSRNFVDLGESYVFFLFCGNSLQSTNSKNTDNVFVNSFKYFINIL